MITLITLVAYVLIGLVAARIAQPAIISRHTYQEGDKMRSTSTEYVTESGYHHHHDGIYRRAVFISTWMMIFTWPVYGFVLGINARIDRTLNEADPVVQQRRIKEQQERIANLERELGVEKS